MKAGEMSVQLKERLKKALFLCGEHVTPIFTRAIPPPGFAMNGPVILEEKTSIVVIEPGWRFTVDKAGNLLLQHNEVNEGARA